MTANPAAANPVVAGQGQERGNVKENVNDDGDDHGLRFQFVPGITPVAGTVKAKQQIHSVEQQVLENE